MPHQVHDMFGNIYNVSNITGEVLDVKHSNEFYLLIVLAFIGILVAAFIIGIVRSKKV
jgi:hypothetical protein